MTTNVRFALNALIASLVFSLILFIAAGTPAYLQGWIFLVTNLVTSMMNAFGIRIDTGLMNERMKPGEGAKAWDKKLLGVSFVTYIITIVLAGLDSGRYRLSPDLPWFVCGMGVLLTLAGQYLFLTARNENKFFSTVVRIQKERGHAVCDTGVYRVVRHPGYTGMIVSTLGLPLVLGSLWSAIPTVVSVGILVTRTVLEDRTLIEELPGYEEYTLRTPYRLLPSVW